MKLSVDELKKSCNKQVFNFTTTEEIEPFENGIIGQQRAVDAVNLGLRMKQNGYNIFIAGPTGTGKTTYARTVAQQKAVNQEVPPDLCYVYNFKKQANPKTLILPTGTGERLCLDMEKLIEELREEIPKFFESEEHEKKKNAIVAEFQEATNKIIEDLEREIRKDNFILQNSGQGTIPSPVPVDEEGKPIIKERYQQLPEKERNRIRDKNLEIQEKMEKVRHTIRGIRLETQKHFDQLEKEFARSILQPIFVNLKEKYPYCTEISEYLNDVKNDIVENIAKFIDQKEENNFLIVLQQGNDENFFKRYQVNLFVNNKDTKGAPVIVESNPTYYNLFGKIEGKSQFGTIITDFTMIKPGSIHCANGGYLIINAQDLLKSPFSWETLKRILINRKIVIENIGEQYRTVPMTTLKPAAIPVDLKVILIGNPWLYQLLYQYDEEFMKLFKIKADFDIEMKRNNDNLKKFAAFISCICKREKIRHFTVEAVVRVVEYSSRLSEDKNKLSTRFNEILEILYEADAWAEENGNKYIEAGDVSQAIREKNMRSNLLEEKIQEMIERGQILLDVEGEEVGQINGLSVYQTGQYSFGRPSRITARTHLGQAGVINIDREAKMSGNIHNKAVMILAAYLAGQYAQEKPLSLSASLAFEQNYGGIDGDSASCAELVVLLSAITEIPIKQSLAITGSMNQKGMVQPIGGVNEKIEGYFKVCCRAGLSGKQGVIIPQQNVDHLMLDDSVIKAVEAGNFSIYAIKNIDQAIELMMGKTAGEIHQQVAAVLLDYAEKTEGFFDDE